MSDHQLAMATIRALRAQAASLARDLAALQQEYAEYQAHTAASHDSMSALLETADRDLAAAKHARDQYQAEFNRAVELLYSTEGDLAAAQKANRTLTSNAYESGRRAERIADAPRTHAASSTAAQGPEDEASGGRALEVE